MQFIDSSPNPNIVTAYGNAKISTSEFYFGSSSISFDGTNSYLNIPYNANTDFGTSGDFTVETFFKLTSPAGYYGWFDKNSSAGMLSYLYPALNKIYLATNGTDLAAWNYTFDSNWHHISLMRRASYYYLYIDGVQITSPQGAVATAGTLSGSYPIQIGRRSVGDGYLYGYLCDYRVSSIARTQVVGTFPVPKRPYGQPISSGGN